ncbi:TadE/TadG family type IV pilus assembly protein [Myceligenerans cantabricum]
MRRPPPRCRACEAGSASIEAAVLLPAIGLLVLLVTLGARVAIAEQSIQTVAAEAARAASIARTPAAAEHDAATAAAASLAGQDLECAETSTLVDTSQVAQAPGVPSLVSVTVTCVVRLADLGMPAVTDHTISATMTSPVDQWVSKP